tara:strand:+ start:1294 stop:1677 length:384 start_codon:yes stop_codon:yes gene_type:complete
LLYFLILPYLPPVNIVYYPGLLDVNSGPEYLSVNKTTDATLVRVEQNTPFGKTIPSSGNEKLITSPVGISKFNNSVPVFVVVVKTTEPVPPPDEDTIKPLNLTAGAITAVVEAAVNLVACMSFLNAM